MYARMANNLLLAMPACVHTIQYRLVYMHIYIYTHVVYTLNIIYVYVYIIH